MRIAIPLVLLLTLVVGLPHEASACECVAVPSAIKPESKGVLAIGTVRDIRPVDPDGWYTKAVVIDITDGLRNATAAETITFYTSAQESACGYSFTSGRQYLIDATSVDDSPGAVIPLGVPPHSQVIDRCGRTRELNTSDGEKNLAEIREMLRQLPPK